MAFMRGLIAVRTDLTRQQKKSILDDFASSLPEEHSEVDMHNEYAAQGAGAEPQASYLAPMRNEASPKKKGLTFLASLKEKVVRGQQQIKENLLRLQEDDVENLDDFLA